MLYELRKLVLPMFSALSLLSPLALGLTLSSLLLCASGCLFGVLMLIREGRTRGRYARWGYALFAALSLAGLSALFFPGGLAAALLCVCAASLSLCVFLTLDSRECSRRQAEELKNARADLLLSQIRPHFLYNTLSSIYVLCREEPAEALPVIEHFMDYLQANFKGIAAKAPISFSDELKHTQAYLEVEKLRFGDALTVSYDTPVTAFRCPSLTLQPLVENAVKHGVAKGQREEHILIRTELEDGCGVILVEDDGPGFDPETAEKEAHIGLDNVRARLAAMCGGSLSIESAPGQGTRARIVIPGVGENAAAVPARQPGELIVLHPAQTDKAEEDGLGDDQLENVAGGKLARPKCCPRCRAILPAGVHLCPRCRVFLPY